MRLSVSLALWLVSLSVLVIGLHGWWQLADEEEDLYAAATRELTLIATAVRSAVENAVRDDQEADIETLLEQLELKDPVFDVFVFGSDSALMGSSRGSAGNLPRALALAKRNRARDALFVDRLKEGDISVTNPFRIAGRIAGQIVILRPPNTLRADLREERNAILISIAALVALLSIGIWIVLDVRLQRPISQMVAVVHRVAGGDLSARMSRSGSDELAVLAREFDLMVASLERTRAQLSHEAETRERLESEMLRANRLAIVGQIAATLAHEIGSPLQVLGGRAHDIVRRKGLPDDVSRSAAIIEEQVDRVHGIVERFLDVARRKAPVTKEVDVFSAVSEVAELLAPQFRRRAVRLHVDVPTDRTVRADPAQLQQVLINLLQNALRASPPDSTVRVRVAPSSFQRHPGRPPQVSVALSVEDEGPGVPDDAADLVFQPFFTAWRTDPEILGTGLGLSVVRSIMDDHSGVVRLERARDGHGARFVVHFPEPPEPGESVEESS